MLWFYGCVLNLVNAPIWFLHLRGRNVTTIISCLISWLLIVVEKRRTVIRVLILINLVICSFNNVCRIFRTCLCYKFDSLIHRIEWLTCTRLQFETVELSLIVVFSMWVFPELVKVCCIFVHRLNQLPKQLPIDITTAASFIIRHNIQWTQRTSCIMSCSPCYTTCFSLYSSGTVGQVRGTTDHCYNDHDVYFVDF